MQFDLSAQQLVGDYGMLPVDDQDEITKKLAMLIEGDFGAVATEDATWGNLKALYR